MAQGKNKLTFIKELAKYYMSFLETDFHRRRIPKRHIKYRDKNNLLVGITLNKYPDFEKRIYKLINRNFKNSYSISIKKGTYKTRIPDKLFKSIKLRIDTISDSDLNNIYSEIEDIISTLKINKNSDYNALQNAISEKIERILKKNIVIPVIKSIDQDIDNMGYVDENTIFLLEEELSNILLEFINIPVLNFVQELIKGQKVKIKNELIKLIKLEEIQNNILLFFNDFKLSDLYDELMEIMRNRRILDKQDLYLYFYDIGFEKFKYPIFYIPFNINKSEDSLQFVFDSQMFINKKALEYVVQEYNKQNNSKGSLQTILERIIYLADMGDNLLNKLQGILKEIQVLFGIKKKLNITSESPQKTISFLVSLSNTCYLSLFDKSDESLINDYEDILKLLSKDDSILGEAFDKLINNFIFSNPTVFNNDLDDQWEQSKITDKLVYSSPIPLNSEQRKILFALHKPDCKYITVEGPPGTGKSHTITAIVFEAILKNQSVLVLSDKKEALDVVEDKITNAMNKIRKGKNFQNPLLRLGKTGNTYAKILAVDTIDNIRTHYRVIKNNYTNLEKNINKIVNTSKEDIRASMIAYNKININEIKEYTELELYFDNKDLPIDLSELMSISHSAEDLEELIRLFSFIQNAIKKNNIFKTFNASYLKHAKYKEFEMFVKLLKELLKISNKFFNDYSIKFGYLDDFKKFSDRDTKSLEDFIQQYDDLKNFIFGYLFKKAKLTELNRKFKKRFPHYKIEMPEKKLKKLKMFLELMKVFGSTKKNINKKFNFKFDYLKIIFLLINNQKFNNSCKNLTQISNEIDKIRVLSEYYPDTFKKFKFSEDDFSSFLNNDFINLPKDEFHKILRYLHLDIKLKQDFSNIPIYNYLDHNEAIYDLITTQMTFLMDDRLINFIDQNRAEAITIKDIIRKKKKFPKKSFNLLKEAFPCILAGIRDYAEYIPLEPELFDLLIIDEASQVSIAQAFPAILRAKKVIIFGDKKQFSNVKAAHARTDTNKQFLNNLEECFIDNISNHTTHLVKLEKFNIKTSILEFFEFITNYNARLLKFFRGYKEIISYSNKYFYGKNLQVMKIRGKPIDEVLKFTILNHDGRIEEIPNTNILEVKEIEKELDQIRKDELKLSVGIITPHTNQQKILTEYISKSLNKDYYFDELKLKIMTFDTCQGEERDLILYSMVANKNHDRLWGVFIKNLSNVDLEEEGKIKAQRLNVGFSRSKECCHFLLSKPIEEYNGSIGEALRHYRTTLNEAQKEKSVDDVDPKSKMERSVLNWFYQTEFYNNNKDNIEFKPQFEIGKYLRQLDITYDHPNYIVDFLLLYRDSTRKEHKIIIEYDGFKEHFSEIDNINEFNYSMYYSDDDVYREKVLESYNYKFLRINKFNLGDNPIATLDKRIKFLIKSTYNRNNFLKNLSNTIEGLQHKEMKECPECREIKKINEFKDDSLVSGIARICNTCRPNRKSHKREKVGVSKSSKTPGTDCPKCGKSMVRRSGRYGEFYGCSNYPYCKGTRTLKSYRGY